MEHPILNAIRNASFTPLGWFAPGREDRVPHEAQFVILIGNAGPEMFRRFARERDPQREKLDDWTSEAIGDLARDLDARAIFPFDKPPYPFLTWARRGGAGHVSPLGLNIHPQYGLWHAYRAALLFPVAFDLPPLSPGPHPCEACADKPCLSTWISKWAKLLNLGDICRNVFFVQSQRQLREAWRRSLSRHLTDYVLN